MTPELAALGLDEGARIRFLNDRLRTTGAGGEIFVTCGIASLPEHDQVLIMERVRTFDAFTEDNDPDREHGFGAFTYAGREIFWNIDYYDPSMEFGSEDPSDDEATVRVLTVLFADEY